MDLAGIQHFAFCRRQWALIHIEQQWAENYLTATGQLLHRNVHDDEAYQQLRGSVLVSRGVRVHSVQLGITGVCDIVEFHRDAVRGVSMPGVSEKCVPIPVEYKRGRPKEGEEDVLQLVAQALCLEEMMLCDVPVGYLYYGQTRRRFKVEITCAHKQRAAQLYQEMHALFQRQYTPAAKKTARCKSCSLANHCLPKLEKTIRVQTYIDNALRELAP